MSCFSVVPFKKSFLLGAVVLGILSLGACQKADIITQPDAPKNTATTTTATAQPTFNAESFSTNGLTIVEGKDFVRVANPQPVAVAGKSEVVEFFWYGCGHCYAIEPAVHAWKKTLPANVNFVRYHAQWNAAMQTQQRMAMTVQALGKSDELDLKIFSAIQEQGKGLSNDDAVSAFMAQNGVDKAAWDTAYRSFDVNASIVTADALFKAYQLYCLPKFIVNGKYVVSGDSAQTLKVVNKLLEQK